MLHPHAKTPSLYSTEARASHIRQSFGCASMSQLLRFASRPVKIRDKLTHCAIRAEELRARASFQTMITVHHTKERAHVVADIHLYCGRATSLPDNGMINAKVGNPNPISRSCTRNEAIEQYRRNTPVSHGPTIARIALRHQQGKHIALYCWCAPLPCHCDVIKEIAMAAALTPIPTA